MVDMIYTPTQLLRCPVRLRAGGNFGSEQVESWRTTNKHKETLLPVLEGLAKIGIVVISMKTANKDLQLLSRTVQSGG